MASTGDNIDEGMRRVEALVADRVSGRVAFEWNVSSNASSTFSEIFVLKASAGDTTSTGRFTGRQLRDLAAGTARPDVNRMLRWLVDGL